MEDALSWVLTWLLIWHVMADGILVKFDASHHAVIVLLLWKSHPGLANRTGATFEVVLAWCQECSFKLCWSFGTFEHTILQCRRLRKNYYFQAATNVSKGPKPNSRLCSQKMWSCEVVGTNQFSKAIQLGKMEDALSWTLIIDLTCHGQWHTSQVRRQMQW